MIITIDGGCWTGKSAVAKALAKLLNYTHINTGSMFRAVAYKAKENNISFDDVEKVTNIANNLNLEFKLDGDQQQVFVDNINLTDKLNSPLMVPLAAKIAQIPSVRTALLELQRKMAQEGNVIFEGRDMGSVVFPNADWKFYLDASTEIRVERFIKVASEEEKAKYSKEEIRKIIEETDFKDKNRDISPLKVPENGIIYDNSSSPTAEQDAIVMWYYIKGKGEIIKNMQRFK